MDAHAQAVDPARLLAASLLAGPGWDPVRRGLRRRDATALRVMLGRELDQAPGPDGDAIDVDRLLRRWARFGQAIYDEDLPAVCELAGTPDTGWGPAVAQFFASLLEQFPAPSTVAGVRARATFFVFVYAETVVFWEYAVVPEQVLAMREALAGLADGLSRATASEQQCAELLGVVVELMVGLGRQLEVESATAGCSVRAVRETAGRARETLRRVDARIAGLWDEVAAGLDPVELHQRDDLRKQGIAHQLLALLALLWDDLSGTLPYFDLIADHIAPASEAFLANLVSRTKDEQTAEALVAAAERCREFEQSEAGGWSVFATEVRAQRIPLETAAAHCRSRDLRTLELAAVEVTYLYPFGLPVAATGVDVLPELMAALGRPDLGQSPITQLAGAKVVIDDAPRTDGWLASTAIQKADYQAYRAVFPDHELVLTTADGVTLVGLDVDVRLSGMGNHYVRIRLGADTRVADGSAGTAWTAHDLEQAIRRGGQVGGVERVWLRARTPGCVDTAPVDSLLAFATWIVRDLATAAHRVEGSSADELAQDLEIAVGFLARYGQLLVTVGQANAVLPGGQRVPLADPDDLAGVVGVPVALTAQRPLAQSSLEWITYARPEESVRANRTLSGRIRRELIWCSGDVTVVFGPTAPHWQLLGTQAQAEFAASLIGVYWRRQQWLRRVVDDAGSTLEARSDVIGELAAVESMEARLSDAIRHVQLLVDRANEHRLSKDQQGRELTHHLMRLNGVAELERSVGATVQAALGTQRILQDRLAALREEERKRLARQHEERAELAQRWRQRPLEILLTVLAALGLIDLFAWSNEAWGVSGDRVWWLVELGVIVAIGAVVWRLSRRAWGEPPPADEPGTRR